MRHKQKQQNNEKGFILVAVLFLIAFLSLAVAYFSNWVTGELPNSKNLQQKREMLIQAASLKADFLFLFATQRLTVKGLEIVKNQQTPTMPPTGTQQQQGEENEFVSLFNKPYKFEKLLISIQDEAGLLNIGKFGKEHFNRLFELFEIDQEEWDSLQAKFKDYVTKNPPNTQQSLLGASAKDYEEAGKPEPAEEALRTPFEIKRVMDWDKFPQFFSNNALPSILSTATSDLKINLNTAPLKVLSFIKELNSEAIGKIIQKRNSEEPYFKQITDVTNATGVTLPRSRLYSFFPATTQRVTITSIDNPLNLQFSVTLTPRGEKAPWRFNYELPMPYIPVQTEEENGTEGKEKLVDVPVFPDPKTLFAEK